jgi:hypothetical protein
VLVGLVVVQEVQRLVLMARLLCLVPLQLQEEVQVAHNQPMVEVVALVAVLVAHLLMVVLEFRAKEIVVEQALLEALLLKLVEAVAARELLV